MLLKKDFKIDVDAQVLSFTCVFHFLSAYFPTLARPNFFPLGAVLSSNLSLLIDVATDQGYSFSA
jgi:hypothetical protein